MGKAAGSAGGGGGAAGALAEGESLATTNATVPPTDLARTTTWEVSRNEARRALGAIDNDGRVGLPGSQLSGSTAGAEPNVPSSRRVPRTAFLDMRRPFSPTVDRDARDVMRRLNAAGYNTAYRPRGGEPLNARPGVRTPRIYVRRAR